MILRKEINKRRNKNSGPENEGDGLNPVEKIALRAILGPRFSGDRPKAGIFEVSGGSWPSGRQAKDAQKRNKSGIFLGFG